jgi:hypothetical protein
VAFVVASLQTYLCQHAIMSDPDDRRSIPHRVRSCHGCTTTTLLSPRPACRRPPLDPGTRDS